MKFEDWKERKEALRLEVAVLDREMAKNRPDLYRAIIDREDREPSQRPPTKPMPPGGYIDDLGHHRVSSTGPFKNFGEQLRAIMMAAMPNQKPDIRLYEVGEARAYGLGESVGSEGGFLVQQDFATDLLRGVFEVGKLAKRCLKFELGADKNGIKLPAFDETSRATGSRLGGIRGYWKGEGDEKEKSKPKFRLMELDLKKLIGLCYASDELLGDVAILERVIRTGFADEFGFLLDLAILAGTGAGQPLGIFTSGCRITQDAETGQAGTEILVENITKMYSRWLGDPARGVWLVERSVLPQLFTMGITVGMGGSPIFMPAGGLSKQPFNTILGMPVVMMEQCSVLGTEGDIVLADFGWYTLIDKPLQDAVSIHARFIYDESVFRFVYRVDGQPILAGPITPYSGGETVSPFVTLATR